MSFFVQLKSIVEHVIKYILSVILDILLPRSQEIQNIETLSSAEFKDKAATLERNIPLSRTNHVFSPIYSLFSYKNPFVQQALWELKYKANTKIARLFAELLHENIITEIARLNTSSIPFSQPTNIPLLIPLPSSKKRYKEKGWNQTFLLADALEKLDRNQNFIVHTDILYKTRHTDPQRTLKRKARLNNLKDCFSVTSPELIKNKSIILLDDVATTGSTLLEAANTLYSSGAGNIVAFTIAR